MYWACSRVCFSRTALTIECAIDLAMILSRVMRFDGVVVRLDLSVILSERNDQV
jgi:hypothetical protein